MDRAISQATLVRLSDTDLVLEHENEDMRGFKVVGKSGDEIGKVGDLMIDSENKRVRFLEVGAGGSLGLGETRFMVPVDAIIRIADKAVYIDRTREHIEGAPRYDPDLTTEEDYWGSVYGYYGCTPYWGAGYYHPGMPFTR